MIKIKDVNRTTDLLKALEDGKNEILRIVGAFLEGQRLHQKQKASPWNSSLSARISRLSNLLLCIYVSFFKKSIFLRDQNEN